MKTLYPKSALSGVLKLSVYLVLISTTLNLAAEEPAELDDLLVTAALEPISARDVAGSVTVITREEIEQRQVKYLADLLRDVPGFAVSQAGGPGALTQIRVRGAEANHVLVLIDGIRANDPASGDEFQFEYQSTANIERIEIVRGPQSAIWGTDALAGVINIITRKNVSDAYLKAEAEYGSFDSLSLAANGGVSRDRFRIYGGLSYLDSEGINISREGEEKDGSQNSNANLNLEFDLADAWQLNLTGQYVDAESEFDGVDFFVSGLPVDADRLTEASRTYVQGELRYQAGDSGFSSAATLNWLDSDNDNFSDGVLEGSTAAEKLEFRLRGSQTFGSDSRHRITVAFDHEDTDFSQRGTAAAFGDPNQDQSYDRSGYAAEYVGSPLEGFHWTANARLDDFSDFDNAFTWQIAASHRFNSRFRLRGSVGEGSKAPGFIERFGFFPDLFIGNPDLKPEKSKGWELGFETGAENASWTFSAVWFHQELEDEIDGFVFDPDTFLFTAANKEGKSQRQGVELEFSSEVAQGLILLANYTYTDATEENAAGMEVEEVRRPRHMGSLSMNYVFSQDRGNINLNVNYNGSQLDNLFPPPFFAPVSIKLDSFTLVDLGASWKLNQHFEIFGRVTNLLDEDYEEIVGFSRPGRGVYAGIRGRL